MFFLRSPLKMMFFLRSPLEMMFFLRSFVAQDCDLLCLGVCENVSNGDHKGQFPSYSALVCIYIYIQSEPLISNPDNSHFLLLTSISREWVFAVNFFPSYKQPDMFNLFPSYKQPDMFNFFPSYKQPDIFNFFASYKQPDI